MDDDTVVRRPFGKVTMTPDVVKTLKIGRLVFGSLGIIPEADRHRRKCLCADQFALFTPDRLSVFIPDVDCKSKARALNFAFPDGLQRIAQDKAGNNVRST